MAKFHVTKAGRVEPCGATVRICPLGEGELGDDNHFESAEEAAKVSVKSELILNDWKEEALRAVEDYFENAEEDTPLDDSYLPFDHPSSSTFRNEYEYSNNCLGGLTEEEAFLKLAARKLALARYREWELTQV